MSFKAALKNTIASTIDGLIDLLPKWSGNSNKILAIESTPGATLIAPYNTQYLNKEYTHNYKTGPIDTLPNKHIHLLKDVFVSKSGVIFKNLRIFIPSLVVPDDKIQSKGSIMDMHKFIFLSQQWSGKVVHPVSTQESPLALVHELWSARNYYHWVCDALPRLILLQQFYPKCTLILPDPTPDYITNSIKLLGYEKTVRIDVNTIVKADYLVRPEAVSPNGEQHPYLINKVKDLLTSNRNQTSNQDRIYVSRLKANVRRIVNEDEVIKLFTSYGFKIVYFEDSSFEEQVQMMQNTKILAGAHGAGFTNLLFMPDNSFTIELINKNAVNTCYYHLASNTKIHHSVILCDAIEQAGIALNDFDIQVNIEELKSTLELVTQAAEKRQ